MQYVWTLDPSSRPPSQYLAAALSGDRDALFALALAVASFVAIHGLLALGRRRIAHISGPSGNLEAEARLAALTPRERDILDAIAAGLGNKAIARQLALSPRTVEVYRAEGYQTEALAEPLPEAQLGRECEWEETPETSLMIVDDLDQAIALFNRYSPQFTVSLISEDAAVQERFYSAVNAPFVGNGITRWVDGQYALNKPELVLKVCAALGVTAKRDMSQVA